jgi:uncharacterized damage-inducible protein DinB
LSPIAPSVRISRPAAGEHIAYYSRYIDLVPGEDALPHLESQIVTSLAALRPLDDARAMHRYAPGKWSVKEVVGHVMDAERVWAYRALRFARADAAPLPGFDENAWVPAGRFDRRPLGDLLDEWAAARASTLALYRGFDEEALLRHGTADGNPMSVRALGWITAGHERHHLTILRERYGIA